MKIVLPSHNKHPFHFRILAVLCFCLFFLLVGQAQNNLPAYAKEQIEQTRSSRAKLDSIQKYMDKLYALGHFDESFQLAEEGLKLSNSLSLDTLRSDFEINIARCYNRRNELTKAIDYGHRAIRHADTNNLNYMSFLYNIHSMFYLKANMMDSALYYNYFADSLFILSAPERRFISLSTRSDIYEKQGLNDLALETAELAVDIVLQEGDDIEKLWLLYDIKELCVYINQIEKYGYYTQKYLELSSKRDSTKNFHRGTFNLDYKSLNEQIEIVEKVVDYYKNSYYAQGYNLGLEKLTKLYLKAERYQDAYKVLRIHEPLIKTAHFENGLYQFYARKYQLEKALGLTDKALVTADIVLDMRDTIQSLELIKQSLDLAEKYESKAKDQEIKLLNQEGELKDLYIEKANRSKWLFGIGALLLLCFSYFLYRNVRAKKKTNAKLEEQNTIIQQNLIEKETLLKEIHHRVKNNLQIISSLLRLQSRSIDDPSTKEALLDGQNRVQSMALIHQNLYKEDNLTGVEVKKYFENLCQNLLSTYSTHQEKIKLDLDIAAINLDVSTLIPMGLIVNELFTNSLKYAFTGDGPFILGACLQERDQQLQLRIFDNGTGISDELKEYLNGRPNNNRNKAWGFGTRLLRSFSQKLEADMIADNKKGTQVELFIKNYKIV